MKKREQKKRKARRHTDHPQLLSEQRQNTTLAEDIIYLILKILIIAVIFILLFTFLFGIYRNKDPAMQPAVKDGDLTFFYRLDKEYVAGDCVMLSYEGKKQIRRIVAVAGDTVDMSEGRLIINGATQQETAIYEETMSYEEGIKFPITVGKGQIFVLGDARSNATDSRIYGAVNVKDTLGKIMLLIRRRSI